MILGSLEKERALFGAGLIMLYGINCVNGGIKGADDRVTLVLLDLL